MILLSTSLRRAVSFRTSRQRSDANIAAGIFTHDVVEAAMTLKLASADDMGAATTTTTAGAAALNSR